MQKTSDAPAGKADYAIYGNSAGFRPKYQGLKNRLPAKSLRKTTAGYYERRGKILRDGNAEQSTREER